jgi:hypothetical protein
MTVSGRSGTGQPVLAQDFLAELDAAVTDEDARAGDELSNLVLTLSAKVAAGGAAPFAHAKSISS